MTNRRRLLFRILLAVSILGGLAAAVFVALAFSALSGGPTRVGYDLLAIGIVDLQYLTSVVVVTVIIGTTGPRVRFGVGGMALASGVVGGIAAGLVDLGSTLNRVDPHPSPALNSLILAISGVGGQIAPVALGLAFGAVALAARPWITRFVAIRRAAGAATA